MSRLRPLRARLCLGGPAFGAGRKVHAAAAAKGVCRKSGKTVVVVTHNGALAPTADILMRMKSGKIESLTENPSPVPVQELEW